MRNGRHWLPCSLIIILNLPWRLKWPTALAATFGGLDNIKYIVHINCQSNSFWSCLLLIQLLVEALSKTSSFNNIVIVIRWSGSWLPWTYRPAVLLYILSAFRNTLIVLDQHHLMIKWWILSKTEIAWLQQFVYLFIILWITFLYLLQILVQFTWTTQKLLSKLQAN